MLTARLDEARRQKREDLRQAVNFIARAEVEQGIEVLAAGGCVHTEKEAGERHAQLIENYLQMPSEERAETLVLAGTNEDRLAITNGMRAGLQAEGALGADTFDDAVLAAQRPNRGATALCPKLSGRRCARTDSRLQESGPREERGLCGALCRCGQQYADTRNIEAERLEQIQPDQCAHISTYTVLEEAIAPGDKLKWTKNNPEENRRNGQQFTVTAVAPTGAAKIVDEAGSEQLIHLNGYQHVDYAWVSTTYGSQGKTADNVLALVDHSSNQEAFYVAVSRAKHQLNLYTPSVDALQKVALRSRASQNVSDFLTLFEVVTNESSTTADYARELSEMLVNALAKGNEPLHQEILVQSKRISELEYAQRTMSKNLAMFLSELKATLSAETSGTGLKKTLSELTAALNRLSDQQAQLLGSIDALNTKLDSEPEMEQWEPSSLDEEE